MSTAVRVQRILDSTVVSFGHTTSNNETGYTVFYAFEYSKDSDVLSVSELCDALLSKLGVSNHRIIPVNGAGTDRDVLEYRIKNKVIASMPYDMPEKSVNIKRISSHVEKLLRVCKWVEDTHDQEVDNTVYYGLVEDKLREYTVLPFTNSLN